MADIFTENKLKKMHIFAKPNNPLKDFWGWFYPSCGKRLSVVASLSKNDSGAASLSDLTWKKRKGGGKKAVEIPPVNP